MHEVVDIKTGVNLLELNRQLAKQNEAKFKEAGVKAIDIMGAIGSGKTLIIEGLVDRLKEKNLKCAAIAGDVAGMDDHDRMKRHGIPVVNINTGKECHLDTHSVQHAMEHLELNDVDVLFIENVGNLVCPADFPLGTSKRMVVISVTEGDDMVRKHPVIFGLADVIVINKVDLVPHIDVDPKVIIADAEKVAPHTRTVLTNAKTGEGFDELLEILGF